MKNFHSRTIHVDGKDIPNPDYISGCEATRLIQRLKLPQKVSLPAFGGGLKHGGLSDKAWEIISAICSFDAMGASEFEMGALPEAIQKLNDGFMNLEAYPMTVSGNPNFSLSGKFQEYESSAREMIRKDHKLEGTVFVLAPRHIRLHVEGVICALALGKEDFLMEHTYLNRTLFTSLQWVNKDGDDGKWQLRIPQGWLELDNGFMFFANEDMWREFCELFGVVVSGVTETNPVYPDYTLVNKALESCPLKEKVAS